MQKLSKKEYKQEWYIKNRARELAKHHTLEGRYRVFKKAAKNKNTILILSFEEFSQIANLPCKYCGGLLPSSGAGIDRIDSTKAYSLDNCAPCCTDCNIAKNNLTEQEFKNHIKSIYLHWASK